MPMMRIMPPTILIHARGLAPYAGRAAMDGRRLVLRASQLQELL